MMSISQVVEQVIKNRPYLTESLAAGIINVSSLARQLQPEIEKALRREVNTGAIVMALIDKTFVVLKNIGNKKL